MAEDTPGAPEARLVLIDEWFLGLWGPAGLSEHMVASLRYRVASGLMEWIADFVGQLSAASGVQLVLGQ